MKAIACLRQKKRQRGFTLVEVLVSVLILAIGLLGMAGLQVVGLRNNQTSYLRAQATQLAYDMTDRMRANLAGLAAYTGAQSSDNCVTNVCTTPTQMAGFDLKQWKDAVAAQLPGGVGTITANASVYSISVKWKEKKEHKDQATTSDLEREFLTSFQP